MTNRHPGFLHLFNILATCLILLFCVAVGNLCKTMLSENKQGIIMAMTMTMRIGRYTMMTQMIS